MNTDICERTELQELQDLYSDLHKDLYGCRPNTLISSNIEFLQERIADMSAEIQTYEDIERDAEERRFVLWEKRISEMMETHSISKARAIAWDMQAEDVDGDIDFYCYLQGLSYSREPAIRKIINEGLGQ